MEEKVDTEGRKRKEAEDHLTDYLKGLEGFTQIMLSTEGETEIKRQGYHFSAISHTIYLILQAHLLWQI